MLAWILNTPLLLIENSSDVLFLHNVLHYFKTLKIDQVYSNTRVPTQLNTSQHKSTRVRHDSTRVSTTPTRVKTNQHESNTGPDHEKEKNMAKGNDKT